MISGKGYIDAIAEDGVTRRESTGSQMKDFYIQEAIAYMEQNYRRNLTVEEIAILCGYPNQLHFSRAFKKRYGISPREWRAQNVVPGKR